MNFESSDRDWVEDFPHDNGQYMCLCHNCDLSFIGYKRRITCKSCETKLKMSYNNSTTENLNIIPTEIKMKIDSLQAKIDALMLEYCPNDMTKQQLDNWASRQKPVSKEVQQHLDELTKDLRNDKK